MSCLILGLRPFGDKISQSLQLDCSYWPILDIIREQIDGPLVHPTRVIPIADDLLQWGMTNHGDRVILKVMDQLLRSQENAIDELLVIWVALL